MTFWPRKKSKADLPRQTITQIEVSEDLLLGFLGLKEGEAVKVGKGYKNGKPVIVLSNPRLNRRRACPSALRK